MGSANRPVYFSGGVPAVVSGIGDSNWKPNITANSVTAEGLSISGAVTLGFYKSCVLGVDSSGLLKKYPSALMTYTTTTAGSQSIPHGSSGGILLANLGIASAGIYIITAKYGSSRVVAMINITSLTDSNTDMSTLLPFYSGDDRPAYISRAGNKLYCDTLNDLTNVIIDKINFN